MITLTLAFCTPETQSPPISTNSHRIQHILYHSSKIILYQIRYSYKIRLIPTLSNLKNKMQAQKSSSSPQAFKSQHHKLIQYLDDFGRQISHRKSTSHTLEQQLSALSRAYNQAQQKLLETQKALMSESILLQKQRTVIEIYKHIIRQNMEDDGILGFIQTLEEDESKKDIYEQLQELRTILNRKRLSSYKRGIEEDRTLKELKKQISRLYEERTNICDESQLIHSENYELKMQLEQSQKEVRVLKDQLYNLRQENSKVKEQLTIRSCQIEKIKQQMIVKNVALEKCQRNQNVIIDLKSEITEINALLMEKLNLTNQESKQNIKQVSNTVYKLSNISLQRKYVNQLDSKLSQLLKYKQQYKKLKESQQNNEFIKKQLSLLKLFMSDEALSLIKEFQQKKVECIENELRNLAAIQKNKLIRLQDCERDVWKYKLQLMREEQGSLNYIPNIYLTQSLQPNLLKSFDNLRPLTQPVSKELAASTNQCRSVSEFISEQ